MHLLAVPNSLSKNHLVILVHLCLRRSRRRPESSRRRSRRRLASLRCRSRRRRSRRCLASPATASATLDPRSCLAATLVYSEKLELLELVKREAIGEILKLNPSYKTPPAFNPLPKEAIVPIP
ncbi:hypothetical protein ACOSQ2_009854 [Xanthoceras sorbifolium]